jgi:hypothetical protein
MEVFNKLVNSIKEILVHVLLYKTAMSVSSDYSSIESDEHTENAECRQTQDRIGCVIFKAIPYTELISFCVQNPILQTRWVTTELRLKCKTLAKPKPGVQPRQYNPRCTGFQHWDYDPTTVPTNTKLTMEHAFCSGGVRRGCKQYEESTNKRGKKCSVHAYFHCYLTYVEIEVYGSHGPDFKQLDDWQLQFRREEVVKLDSFGPGVARGNTGPKRAQIALKATQPSAPMVPRRQIARVLQYERRKEQGFGSNTDRIISFLKDDQTQRYIQFPLVEQDYPSGENNWQIVLSSEKLLEYGVKYGQKIVGIDSRWKTNDVRRPLTLLTATCRGGKAFPIAVMLSESATADDYSRFLDIIAIELENRMPEENQVWDPIFMMDKSNSEKNAVKKRRSYGRKEFQ